MKKKLKLSDRRFSIAGRDFKQEKKEAKAEDARIKKEERKRKLEEEKKEEAEAQAGAWDRLEEICGEDQDESVEVKGDDDYGTRRIHRQSSAPPLNMPRNILYRRLVVEYMNQKGLTADDVVGLLAAIITESGGNTNDYFLSFSNVHDKKTKKTREMAILLRQI